MHISKGLFVIPVGSTLREVGSTLRRETRLGTRFGLFRNLSYSHL